MQRSALLSITLAALLQTACGRDDDARPAEAVPMPETLTGVYAGRFPCSNCAAIEATLWLRADGTFFLRQNFVDEPGVAAPPSTPPSYAVGRWRWDGVAAYAVLRGAGPERRFAALDTDHVELRTASPVPHVLERVVAAPAFGDRLRLDGTSAVVKGRATFTECLTGLTWPVAAAGAFKELERQHRVMNPRGKVALTTVEGHLVAALQEESNAAPAPSEALVVDRFVTIKPGTGC